MKNNALAKLLVLLLLGLSVGCGKPSNPGGGGGGDLANGGNGSPSTTLTKGVIGEKAGDFSLPYKDSDGNNHTWSLSKDWKDTDNNIFIVYDKNQPMVVQAWGQDPTHSQPLDVVFKALLTSSPKNVHYFILFNRYFGGPITPQLDSFRKAFNKALTSMPLADQKLWKARVHFVTTPMLELKGPLGDVIHTLDDQFQKGKSSSDARIKRVSQYFGIAIRRDKVFSPIGEHIFYGLPLLAAEPAYYDYLYNYDQSIATLAKNTKEITLLDKDLVQKDNNYKFEVEFPPKEEMEKYNKLTISVEVQCGPTDVDCGEWDYEAFIQHCRDNSKTCKESDEFIRWITPYGRPGKEAWKFDATDFLPLFIEGGKQFFNFGMVWFMNKAHYTVKMYFDKDPSAPTPFKIEPIFTGDKNNNRPTYDENYNTLPRFNPHSFDKPAGTTKVDLVTIITGHGGNGLENCAEWCPHTHHFGVNTAADTYNYDYDSNSDMALGDGLGCVKKVTQGAIPGQYGNYAPGRSGWCPGLIVKPNVWDITKDVTKDTGNTITYSSWLSTTKKLHTNDSSKDPAAIRFNAYLVYYK